ncbi:MAG: DUF853 family protein [Coriobacteriia bacterium]|nr:DUF853 family protein [Coriobacteriia bacterium]
MYNDGKLIIAQSMDSKEYLEILPRMSNRHGLIAGATGTGKTITVKVLAESFSEAGIPVFLTDVKGDVAGISLPGSSSEDMENRLTRFNIRDAFSYEGFPVHFWDIFGEKGYPIRTTISEMGPLLLARLLNLNEVQTGILNIAFRLADDEGLLLLDLKDLRSMIVHVGERASELKLQYGNISSASIGAIQRALLQLEDQGGDLFFGEPALDINDLIQIDQTSGKGIINLLDSQKLINSPLVYSTFLLWLLSELFESLPEVGDLEKPKLIFFFDEAHLLFDHTPAALVDKIEQVVKLIRSKGVGIYFCTQSPSDIPDAVLAQLGNRVQHALRAYTPKEQKALRAAAQAYRSNPLFDTEEALTQLGTGEALVSFLGKKGEPSVVERAWVLPPESKFGPLDTPTRASLIAMSASAQGVYLESIDRESAYELLSAKAAEQARILEQQRQEEEALKAEKIRQKEEEQARKNNPINKILRSATSAMTSSVGRKIGNSIVRGILGGFKR